MIRKQIRNLHSNKSTAPRVFDVIIKGNLIYLEVKLNKNKYEIISWEDVDYQVRAAKLLAESLA
jgi:hypothetical protein|nr:MAG TPA: hypothetical protein [Siphoviridae sp. ct4aE30]